MTLTRIPRAVMKMIGFNSTPRRVLSTMRGAWRKVTFALEMRDKGSIFRENTVSVLQSLSLRREMSRIAIKGLVVPLFVL